MSKDIEGFYQRVSSDPGLMASLMRGAQSPHEVLTRATAKAGELGYQFSVADATAWSEQQIAARGNGELSDMQLESVAGGKGNAGSHMNGDSSSTVGELVQENIEVYFQSVNNWFQSW